MYPKNKEDFAVKVLVVNCGSSSIKYQLVNMNDESVLAKGLVERIGLDGSVLTNQPEGKDKVIIRGKEFNRNYPAFITSIHDAFGTHPNNAEEMTYHYTNIMCELNESNLLQDIMGQISGKNMLSIKKNTLTNDMIRASIYKLS